MAEQPIAVVVALEDEIRILRSKMQVDAKLVRGPCEILRGTLWKRPVVLVRSGLGSAAMGRALTLCRQFQLFTEIVHIGCMGALVPDLSTGSLLFADAVLSVSSGERFVADQTRLAEASEVWKKQSGLPAWRGALVTSDRLIVDPHQKAFIGAQHGAKGIDMESSAVAAFAEQTKIPWLVARAVFDELDMNFPDLSFVLDARGRPKPLPLLRHIVSHPQSISPFVRMGYAMMKAREAITKFVEAWVRR